jgi:hypothetical protein
MKRKKLWIMAVAAASSTSLDSTQAVKIPATQNVNPQTQAIQNKAASSTSLDATQAAKIPATQNVNPQTQTTQNRVADKNIFWLAKLNSCANFDGKLQLTPINPEADFAAIAAQSGLSAIALEIVDGKFFCPYLFSKLHAYSPEGKKVTLTSGSFNDTNIQLSIAQRNLTIGNTRLENWKNLFRERKLLLLVTYQKNFFQLSSSETKNKKLDNIPNYLWLTPTIKKVAIGAATGLAVALSTYFFFKKVYLPRVASRAVQEPVPNSPLTAGEIPPKTLPDASNTPNKDGTPNVNSQVQSHYFDAKTFNANIPFEQAHPNVIFAGAPNLAYQCYGLNLPIIGMLNFSKNHFKRMLDLDYDLSVAENKCDWTATEAIARELLGIINEYGAPPKENTSDEIMQRMVDYQNMAALHAAMALQRIVGQRRTTEICKAHLGHLTAQELYEAIASRQPSSSDLPLVTFLSRAPENEFIIHQSTFAAYPADHLKDTIELAKILNNPLWLKKIIPSHSPFEANPQQDRATYGERVADFIDKNFNFSGKESLKKIATNFFMKIHDKINKFLTLYSKIKLKFRDCNGGDIFNNGDVCSYCSTFELFRREPGNAPFTAVGGMFNSEEIYSIMDKIQGPRVGVVPHRRFNERGACVYNSSEEGAKITQQREQKLRELNNMGGNIKEYDKKIHNTSDIATQNKLISERNNLVERHRKAVEQYNRDIKSHHLPFSIDLIPTNDLSSRIRVQTAYLVRVTNMNRSVASSPLLQSNAKTQLPVEKSVLPQLAHCAYLSSTSHENLTPTKLLQSADCGDKLSIMFEAMGMSFVSFHDVTSPSSKFSKHFFNETTMNFAEKGSVDLDLGCVHILNPFLPFSGTGGFNDHARLILQY